jgi:hypothetical protein
MRTIKRFSHTKDKDKLAAFLSSNFRIERPCVLGIPISILKLISDGIAAMRAKEAE